ncbi:hypothetical protein B0H34DRAFT_856291 [Crassisporium funariophilum]|nr:hypothetical protein B0H34DRAFT_856291 [Crassisporium funariophilum]
MSAVAAPPDYSKVTAIPETTSYNDLSKEDLHKVHTAVADHLQAPTTRNTLNEEMKNLANTVMSIETDFATITLHMGEIDDKKIILDKEGEVIEYAPKWKILHDEYTSLMNESQTAASKVSEKINELLTVILPIIGSDFVMEKKQRSLTKYIKGLDEFSKQGQKNADRFLRLQQSVDSFRKNLKTTVSDQTKNVKKDMEAIDLRIKNLQKELDESSGFFTSCWDVLKLAGPSLEKSAGGTLAGASAFGTIAATAGLAALAPAVGVGILIAGFAAIGFSIFGGVCERTKLRHAKESEVATLKIKREEKALRIQQLKELLDQLDTLDPIFNRAIDRLSAIHGIWGMLVTDSQRLHHGLTSMAKTDDDLTFEFTARNVKVMYQTLQLALDQYCSAVAKGGITG